MEEVVLENEEGSVRLVRSEPENRKELVEKYNQTFRALKVLHGRHFLWTTTVSALRQGEMELSLEDWAISTQAYQEDTIRKSVVHQLYNSGIQSKYVMDVLRSKSLTPQRREIETRIRKICGITYRLEEMQTQIRNLEEQVITTQDVWNEMQLHAKKTLPPLPTYNKEEDQNQEKGSKKRKSEREKALVLCDIILSLIQGLDGHLVEGEPLYDIFIRCNQTISKLQSEVGVSGESTAYQRT